MADRRTAEILVALEQIVTGLDLRVQSSHTLLEQVHAKIDELKRTEKLSNDNPFRNDEISAKFYLPGFGGGYITKEWWERHRLKFMILILSASTGTLGWFAKAFHITLSK